MSSLDLQLGNMGRNGAAWGNYGNLEFWISFEPPSKGREPLMLDLASKKDLATPTRQTNLLYRRRHCLNANRISFPVTVFLPAWDASS